MISSKDFQRQYIKLYEQMRNYFWGLDVLEDLAKLEVCIYDAFIDRDALRVIFTKLKKDVAEVAKEDEDLAKSLSDLEDLVNSTEESYLQLYKVQEAIRK